VACGYECLFTLVEGGQAARPVPSAEASIRLTIYQLPAVVLQIWLDQIFGTSEPNSGITKIPGKAKDS
jgi:hypothetical protein